MTAPTGGIENTPKAPHPAALNEGDSLSHRGSTLLSEKAVTKIVERATASVPGTTDDGGGLDRIANRHFPRFDIAVDHARNSVTIDATIAATWPSPVTAVAAAVRDTITDWVTGMTGLKVQHVNVTVGQVTSEGKRVTRSLIDQAPRTPSVVPVSVNRTTKEFSPRTEINHSYAATTAPLRPIKVSSPDSLRPVKVEKDQPLRPIHVDEHQPVRSISAPSGDISVRPIHVPRGQEPRKPRIAPAQPPAPIKEPRQREPRHPQLQRPQPPRQPSVKRPQEPRSPQVARVQEPRSPKIRETTKPRPVSLPRETQLSAPTVKRVREWRQVTLPTPAPVHHPRVPVDRGTIPVRIIPVSPLSPSARQDTKKGGPDGRVN